MKLLAREPDFELALSLFEESDRLYSASIGYVEARSALGSMSREGRLRGARGDYARLELERTWSDVNVIQLDDRLVGLAGDAAELSRLRAGEAIHLASALVLEEPELLFATWDPELARAASEAGLAVAP